MSLWKWKEVELEVDMNDADFQEKYENAFAVMEKKEKELLKVGSLSQITREYCKMFFQLFDDIFGAGTSEAMFHGKHNSGLVDEAYDSFLSHCKKEVEQMNKKRFATAKKYKVANKR